MPDPKALSKLTRSLLVGSSAGAIVFQVGCVPPVTYADPGSTIATASQAQAQPAIRVSNPVEAQLCGRANASRSAADAAQLMLQFPASTCIAQLLNSMAPAQLAALPPQAVQGLAPNVLAGLLPSTRNILNNQVLRQAPAGTGTATSVAQEVFDTREGRLTNPRY